GVAGGVSRGGWRGRGGAKARWGLLRWGRGAGAPRWSPPVEENGTATFAPFNVFWLSASSSDWVNASGQPGTRLPSLRLSANTSQLFAPWLGSPAGSR